MRNVIIIGSGIAGYAAAIYAARAELKPVVFSGVQRGGQLTITTDVDNFPGFAQGVLGPDLMLECEKQALRFGTEIFAEEVKEVDLRSRPFTVVSDSGRREQTEALIIATGASAQMLGLPAEKRLLGHGLSACATCDGFFFKGKDVYVVGGGDTAMEEGIFLSRFAKSVSIVHRRDQFRASKIMQEKARAIAKISFILDSVVEDILGDSKVTGIKIKNVKTGQSREVAADGLFYAVGHTPNTKFLAGQVALDPNGYIVVDDRTRTSVPGVFAAGDCADPRYRQAVVAAGSGCKAALEAERALGESH